MANVCWAWKVPLPLPNSTLTVLPRFIGHDDVGFAVAIHIAHHHRNGFNPQAIVCWVWNVPLPLPSSTLTVLLPAIGDDDVGFAVAGQIAPPQQNWRKASGEGVLRLEGAVAVAQQHA